MTDYTVQKFDQPVEYDEMDSPEEIPDPMRESSFDSLEAAMGYVHRFLPDEADVRHRTVGDNTIAFYETGEPWDCFLIRGEAVEDTEESDSTDFGEAISQQEQAAISVEVRRPLNDYSGLDEVFTFYAKEPTVDQADRDATPMVEYAITRGSRTGKPGVDDPEIQRNMMSPGNVPGEVIVRAEKMCEFIEFE